jgi:hypothetical protein
VLSRWVVNPHVNVNPTAHARNAQSQSHPESHPKPKPTQTKPNHTKSQSPARCPRTLGSTHDKPWHVARAWPHTGRGHARHAARSATGAGRTTPGKKTPKPPPTHYLQGLPQPPPFSLTTYAACSLLDRGASQGPARGPFQDWLLENLHSARAGITRWPTQNPRLTFINRRD